MYLFFDVETTGKALNWNAPVSDLNNWPHIVQIAWVFYDYNHNLTEQGNYIIKPNGYKIPLAATEIHGITTEKAESVGVDLKEVLKQFESLTDRAVFLVAHNMNFDKRVTQAAFLRAGLADRLHSKRTICTMMASMNYCKLPGTYGNYKWPKLSELHQKLFGCDFEGAHDAMADIQATAKCFFELQRLGILKDEKVIY